MYSNFLPSNPRNNFVDKLCPLSLCPLLSPLSLSLLHAASLQNFTVIWSWPLPPSLSLFSFCGALFLSLILQVGRCSINGDGRAQQTSLTPSLPTGENFEIHTTAVFPSNFYFLTTSKSPFPFSYMVCFKELCLSIWIFFFFFWFNYCYFPVWDFLLKSCIFSVKINLNFTFLGKPFSSNYIWKTSIFACPCKNLFLIENS